MTPPRSVTIDTNQIVPTVGEPSLDSRFFDSFDQHFAQRPGVLLKRE
jgi:hypothetical protein